MKTVPSPLTSPVSDPRRKEGSPECAGALLRLPRQPVSLLSVLQMESVRQGMDQKLVEGQEKLHQMWLNWNQKQLRGVEKSPAKPEVATVGRGMGAWGPDFPLQPGLRDQPA